MTRRRRDGMPGGQAERSGSRRGPTPRLRARRHVAFAAHRGRAIERQWLDNKCSQEILKLKMSEYNFVFTSAISEFLYFDFFLLLIF